MTRESLRVPFSGRISAFICPTRERRREAVSIDTDERGEKKKKKKKMGKHLRTVDRVRALKAHTGRVTGRCFRLIAGSTIDCGRSGTKWRGEESGYESGEDEKH